MGTSVEAFSDPSRKEPYRQADMDNVIASGNIASVMVIILACTSNKSRYENYSTCNISHFDHLPGHRWPRR